MTECVACLGSGVLSRGYCQCPAGDDLKASEKMRDAVLITATQWRALEIVADRPGLRASHIGQELWNETTPHPKRGEGSHGSNKFCRPAGKILNQLQALGLIHEGTDGAGITWRLSLLGELAMKARKGDDGKTRQAGSCIEVRKPPAIRRRAPGDVR